MQLFLVELEVTAANEVIHRLDLQTLPHIFYIPGATNLEGDGKIKIPPEDVMQVGSPLMLDGPFRFSICCFGCSMRAATALRCAACQL